MIIIQSTKQTMLYTILLIFIGKQERYFLHTAEQLFTILAKWFLNIFEGKLNESFSP